MANKKNTNYEQILNAYRIGDKVLSEYEERHKVVYGAKHKRSYGIKSAVKKQIRRKFHEIYHYNDNKTWLWDELSEMQQLAFIYITMHDYLFKIVDKVYDAKKADDIKKEVNEKVTLNLQVFNLQNQQNLISDKYYYRKEVYERIANQEEQIKEKEKDYNEFKKAFKQVLPPHLNPPTFEEWDKENQQIPRRLKDYELEAVLNNTGNEPYDSDEYIDTTMSIAEFNNRVNADTDHVVLQCIVKILEELEFAKINIDEIEKNSQVLISNIDMSISPPLDYDELLAMSREERLQEIDKRYEGDKDNTSENLTSEQKQEYNAMRAKYDSALRLSKEEQENYKKEQQAFGREYKKREQLDFYELL